LIKELSFFTILLFYEIKSRLSRFAIIVSVVESTDLLNACFNLGRTDTNLGVSAQTIVKIIYTIILFLLKG